MIGAVVSCALCAILLKSLSCFSLCTLYSQNCLWLFISAAHFFLLLFLSVLILLFNAYPLISHVSVIILILRWWNLSLCRYLISVMYQTVLRWMHQWPSKLIPICLLRVVKYKDVLINWLRNVKVLHWQNCYHPCCEGGIVFSDVCLFVCLSVCQRDNSWTVRDIITKFSGHCPMVKRGNKF